MNDDSRWTWAKFLPRFSFGFILGCGMGYLLDERSNDLGVVSTYPGWLTVLGCGILFGLIAWWFGDDYWDTR